MKNENYSLGTSPEFQVEMTEEEFNDFMLFSNGDHTLDEIEDEYFFTYNPPSEKYLH